MRRAGADATAEGPLPAITPHQHRTNNTLNNRSFVATITTWIAGKTTKSKSRITVHHRDGSFLCRHSGQQKEREGTQRRERTQSPLTNEENQRAFECTRSATFQGPRCNVASVSVDTKQPPKRRDIYKDGSYVHKLRESIQRGTWNMDSKLQKKQNEFCDTKL